MTCFNVNFKPIVVAAAAWLTASSPSLADNDVWKTAANGTWGAGASWVDGSTPDSVLDHATINLPGTYTVSFTANPNSISDVTIANGANVTFASSSRPPNPIVPRTLTLVETGDDGDGQVLVSGATLTLGSAATGFPVHLTADNLVQVGLNGTLNVNFGSNVNTAHLSNFGQLNVTGLGSSVAASNDFFFPGDVNVTVGGLLQTGGGIHRAAATVSGAGSRWISTGFLNIGLTDTLTIEPFPGTVSVTGGGLLETMSTQLGDVGDGSGTVTVTGDGSQWVNSGLLNLGGSAPGTINVQPGGLVRGDGETIIQAEGRLRLQGGTFDATDFRIESGDSFEWTSGTFRLGTYHGDLSNSVGTLAPGHSAGVANILGIYGQGVGGSLEIEIGGASQGTQYDVVNVTGNAFLGGQLNLKLINGFIPTPSQTFIVLSANSIGDAFDNVPNGQRLSTVDGGGSFRVNYGAGSAFDPTLVVLSGFQAVALPGDYNADGIVNAADYTVWRDTRGSTTNLAADGSGNGTVDTADYNFWRARFANTAGNGNAAAVPEPAALLLLLLGIVGHTLFHRPCLAARHD